ncbi:MAG: hypothetical protein IKP68_05465 [Clostridia bacterium]|nr:hypothetical protein [Clostridia bacterium]
MINFENAKSLLNECLVGKSIISGKQFLDMTEFIFGVSKTTKDNGLDKNGKKVLDQYVLHIQTDFDIKKNDELLIERTERITYYEYDPFYKNITAEINEFIDSEKKYMARIIDIFDSDDSFPIIKFNDGLVISIKKLESGKELWRVFRQTIKNEYYEEPHIVCYGNSISLE